MNKYILIFFEIVSLSLNFGFDLLRSGDKLLLELELIVVFWFLPDLECAIKFGYDI